MVVGQGKLKIEEINIGDVIYYPVQWEARIHKGTVKSLHPDDNQSPAVGVLDFDASWRVVAVKVAFWTEAEVKNYKKSLKAAK